MSRTSWNTLATICLVLGGTLGVVPLLQWFVAHHRNGLIERLFGFQAGPQVWTTPAIALVLAVIGVLFFGTRADKANR